MQFHCGLTDISLSVDNQGSLIALTWMKQLSIKAFSDCCPIVIFGSESFPKDGGHTACTYWASRRFILGGLIIHNDCEWTLLRPQTQPNPLSSLLTGFVSRILSLNLHPPQNSRKRGRETHSIVVIGRNLVASDTDDHGNSPRTCYRQGHLRDVFHSIPYPVIVQPEGCRHLYALLGPGLHFSFIFPC